MKRVIVAISGISLLLMVFLAMPGGILFAQELGNPYEGYLRINYYLNLNAFEEAEKLIDSYLKSYPDDPYILTEKAFLVQNIDNEPDKTLKLLDQALAIYPEYYYANYLKASLIFTQYPDNKEKIDEAIQLLEHSIKDSPDFYDNYYLMGLILNDREDYAGSNQYFDKANQLEEKIAVYYFMATNYHMLKDQDNEAKTYEKLLSLDPDNYKALRTLSQIYTERKDYKKSVLYLERLYNANPGTRKVAIEYLYSLFASGEHEKFMKITDKMPLEDSSLLIYARAFILSRNKKIDEALAILEGIKRKNSKIYLLMADIYMLKEEAFKAYEVLEKVEMEKRDYFFYTSKLQIMLSLNLNKRIVKLFHQIRLDNKIAQSLSLTDYYAILYAYAHLNRLDMVKEVAKFARSQLRKNNEPIIGLNRLLENFSPDKPISIEENQLFSPNMFILLTLYKKEKQFQNAIKLLESIMALEKKMKKAPSYASSLELCDIKMSQEKFETVETMLKDLMVQFPTANSVKNFYAYFLAMRNKNLPEALEVSGQTLKENKDNFAFLDTYGYILLKMGRLEEAEIYLKKSYDKNPFEKEVMEHMAELYRKTKQFKKIKEMYQRAIDIGVDFKETLMEKMGHLMPDGM